MDNQNCFKYCENINLANKKEATLCKGELSPFCGRTKTDWITKWMSSKLQPHWLDCSGAAFIMGGVESGTDRVCVRAVGCGAHRGIGLSVVGCGAHRGIGLSVVGCGAHRGIGLSLVGCIN